MAETLYQYQYQFGDRPLEGYTIQRAVGRGGFGEVYFAISDSGRQVALKVIQNYEQIELRGIKQCMNLKSPHLVTIFDVKYNDKGRPFVIMEYVSGASLRDLLDESPGGLGPAEGGVLPAGDRQGPVLPSRLRHRAPGPQAEQHLL